MANSRIGAEKLTIAKVLTDVAGGSTTYDTPYEFTKKLMKVGVKNNSTSEMQYADDQAVDIYHEDGDIEIDINVTDLTEDEKALMLGQTMANGIRTPAPTDVRPFFCVIWKSKKRDGTYKYYKILKTQFAEPDEENESKQDKKTPQTDTFKGFGIQRLSDGLRKRIADASSSTYIAGTGSGWFSSGDISPDTTPPTVTVVPADGASNQLVTVNVVWTFDEEILPAFATGSYFTLTKADGTAVAGAVSIDATNKIVTFNPTASLDASSTYIAIASSAITDYSGNHLAANSVTNFGTAS